MGELTAKQQRFVDEYLIDLNGAQAAIRAGYSERAAKEIASENLTKPNIAQAIAARQAETAEKLEIDAEWVLRNAVDLHRRCIAANDRTNERATVELIGKHTNIAAFKERHEHSGTVGYVDLTEDAEVVSKLIGDLSKRSSERPTLQ